MNGDRDSRDRELEPWLAEALDDAEVRAPDSEFRARLRRDFLAGGSEAAAQRPRASRHLAWAIPTLAAAVVLLFFLLRGADVPRLRLVESLPEDVLVDGAPFSPEGVPRSDATIETKDASARIRVDEAWLFELEEDSLVRIALQDDTRGEAKLTIERGALRVVTGATFAPRKLVVVAPDARIEVVGTEFGVDVLEDMGTCVCCTEGTVSVNQGSASAARISAGEMVFCFRSGGEPMQGAVKGSHAAPIEALRRLR